MKRGKTGVPFKASLFGRNAGLSALEKHFVKSKTALKDRFVQQTLKSAIAAILKSAASEHDFRTELIKTGINIVVRRNNTGHIYGITFIDHHSKTVWNGSRLGKELSANILTNIGIPKPKPILNSFPITRHQVVWISLLKSPIIYLIFRFRFP